MNSVSLPPIGRGRCSISMCCQRSVRISPVCPSAARRQPGRRSAMRDLPAVAAGAGLHPRSGKSCAGVTSTGSAAVRKTPASLPFPTRQLLLATAHPIDQMRSGSCLTASERLAYLPELQVASTLGVEHRCGGSRLSSLLVWTDHEPLRLSRPQPDDLLGAETADHVLVGTRRVFGASTEGT
jgi:hypothetical protein